MKIARFLVLAIAVAAGILAFRMVMLSGGSQPESAIAPTVTEPANTQILVAQKDILLGSKLSEEDLSW
ncbi:MAG: Flp pilus assembly protein CpaB, partial [Hyphomicrobiales bacterium]